ncbi:hypothetical protein F4703DRAFT_1848557 [Phycomyces blakesleeanus]
MRYSKIIIQILSKQPTTINMSALQKFLKLSGSKPEIFPLFGIMGIALGGAGFMAVHQARAPDVVWDHKTNASPWQDVKVNIFFFF